ncbi:TauD/TfdA dioxygenase family protein [Streptomyces sp. 1331.2]|uniref:TauD/TfdA dioxygenase family protein n=1 Tax=Streptomyces sp. 1331.2 TaxID=1938835 RepID=UPI000BC8F56A|nr:TauD/TfdA family dioxygenase [Streptomyces sp. 1331.2]SOB81272.1 taurine dioxygenase [Streptomyces sp. 1331.2]
MSEATSALPRAAETTELTGFGLGLRIDGFAPGDHGPQELRALLWEYGVLHLTGFPRDPAEFTGLARWFGEPETVFPAEHRAPGHPEVRLQTNVRGLGANAGGQYWHADGSFAPDRSLVTLLTCDEAPQEEGETLFADLRAGLAALPEEVRAEVSGLNGSFPCRQIAEQDMRRATAMRTVVLSEEERQRKLAELTDFVRPLVAPHHATRRPALVLNEHWLRDIPGRPAADSRQLLALLYDTVTRPANVYRHRWTVGDVLVWDNASVLHKAVPAAPGHRKVTRRITSVVPAARA